MLKDIKEALERYEEADDTEELSRSKHAIDLECVDWLRHLLSIISQKDEEIEKLKELMRSIDNESRMWNSADSALSVIQQIIIQEKVWR